MRSSYPTLTFFMTFLLSMGSTNTSPVLIPWTNIGTDGQPIAVCTKNCPPISKPICAVDNGKYKTFDNECLMTLRNCRTDSYYQFVHQGKC
ncbi:hypothetical protein K457DRAFT_137951 [Linnemannia elongata AG-77]|uniref:Kazal-like domain-containing protein n=1 Tax=Linnemannia elongata AG-77 TaxID=1314771 RepID=A0A197JZ14_9FUNG|nr:hypothetical protein K457DRAFT_137951 [Linnemannia elongata AG-77]